MTAIHNLILSNLSSVFPAFWDYAHPVNAVTVVIAIVLFVAGIRLLAKLAPLLFLIAAVILIFHHGVR